MAHAQKPDFVFRRNKRVHLNRQGRQFSRLLAAEVWASAVVMLDTPCSEVVWRLLATHSIGQFPSLPLPCVTVCHHICTGLYTLYRHRVLWRFQQTWRPHPCHAESWTLSKGIACFRSIYVSHPSKIHLLFSEKSSSLQVTLIGARHSVMYRILLTFFLSPQ